MKTIFERITNRKEDDAATHYEQFEADQFTTKHREERKNASIKDTSWRGIANILADLED